MFVEGDRYLSCAHEVEEDYSFHILKKGDTFTSHQDMRTNTLGRKSDTVETNLKFVPASPGGYTLKRRFISALWAEFWIEDEKGNKYYPEGHNIVESVLDIPLEGERIYEFSARFKRDILEGSPELSGSDRRGFLRKMVRPLPRHGSSPRKIRGEVS